MTDLLKLTDKRLEELLQLEVKCKTKLEHALDQAGAKSSGISSIIKQLRECAWKIAEIESAQHARENSDSRVEKLQRRVELLEQQIAKYKERFAAITNEDYAVIPEIEVSDEG